MVNCRVFNLFWGLVLTLSSLGLSGQTYTVRVLDAERAPLPAASVQMIQLPDSARVSTFTNGAGDAVFRGLEEGLYLLRVSHVAYVEVEHTRLVSEKNTGTEVLLTDRVSELGVVQVTATRPMIRQVDDKTIIDPEPMANIATNTLEVLESTPGLFVDQDGGIYLNSATPAVVYINGREQKMSNQDINTILRSLPPGSVERIEVLRTPSARYAASSSGGIINIVLKKGVRIGRFGSVTAGANQGFYGNQTIGFTLNNSGDRSTQYLNANFSAQGTLEEINAERLLESDTTLMQASNTARQGNTGYVGYGISYDLYEHVNLSYDGRVNVSRRNARGRSKNLVEALQQHKVMESVNDVNNRTGFFSLQQDLGVMVKLDTLGSEWDTKLGYSYNHSDLDQDYTTRYLFPFSFLQTGEGVNLQHRHFILLQSDLSLQLPFRIRLETGAKSTFQYVDSEADFYIGANGSPTPDPLRTNAYRYDEQIHAGYLQASRTLGEHFLLKAGIRLEHTRMDGRQTIPTDTSFIVNRTDWFPYVYLSRKVFSMGEIELRGFMIYRRTVNRPGYQSLNPTIRFVDQFLYETGNPALKPQFTDNVELNISYNEFPVFAVGRNYTSDIFSPVVYQDEDSPEGAAIRTWDNVGTNRETYFRGMAGIPPGGKYFFGIGAQYNLSDYDGFYEGEPFSYQRGSWRLFTFHSLRLFKETRITMMGFMMLGGNYNFYELEPFGMLNFGINQTFFNKKLHVTLNARDVFRTMVTAFELNQGSISTTGDRYADNQRIGINIRYNFGIPTKQERNDFFRMDPEEDM